MWWPFKKKKRTDLFNVVELHSGVRGLCRYRREMALKVCHNLNKCVPDSRYGIIQVGDNFELPTEIQP